MAAYDEYLENTGLRSSLAAQAFSCLNEAGFNCVILLGPTATGKTAVAVRIADAFNGEIISADSRQVYRGLDIGSGKDLCEYSYNGKQIPYNLIDIVTLDTEYSVYSYQQDVYRAFFQILAKDKIPVIAGGTGMYIDSIVRSYDMINVPEDKNLRMELAGLSLDELGAILKKLKGTLHNDTDITEKDRVIRAIEIETFMKSPECDEQRKKMVQRPDIRPFILGTSFPREVLRKRIAARLRSRLGDGMIDEVVRLHDVDGFSWARLERLGLEYRFIAEFLQGKIKNSDELFTSLNTAIGQFAKRQETWFRGMERKGVKINWIPADLTPASQTADLRFIKALQMMVALKSELPQGNIAND